MLTSNRWGWTLDKPLDIAKPGLWKGVPPEEMWAAYRRHLRATVDTIFKPDRPRALVVVRPDVEASAPSA